MLDRSRARDAEVVSQDNSRRELGALVPFFTTKRWHGYRHRTITPDYAGSRELTAGNSP
ncbi:hypothetical protein LZC95_25555 [Pendulispora brunnea]|uniref:Uncharacterized protein n=1 Tax=Pendulispora brunnea TaxID=2905690 RepID=A0ABZ2KNE4_9BACT